MARRPTALQPGEASDDEPALAGAFGSDESFERLRRRVAVDLGAGDAEAEDEHAWMTTYTDMVTLLLTCFIMLISVATFTGSDTVPPAGPPPPESTAPAAAPRAAGAPTPAADDADTRIPDALFLRQPPDTWSARLSRDLQRFVELTSVPGGMTVVTAEAEVTVRLNDGVLFPSGQVEIAPAGRVLLRDIAPLLRASPVRIEVHGHTDAVPIDSWLFPSNWELSGARAAAVVRTLVESGVPPDRLVAAAYADTRPLAGNGTEAGRRLNRRVELVLRTPFDPPSAGGIPAPDANR